MLGAGFTLWSLVSRRIPGAFHGPISRPVFVLFSHRRFASFVLFRSLEKPRSTLEDTPSCSFDASHVEYGTTKTNEHAATSIECTARSGSVVYYFPIIFLSLSYRFPGRNDGRIMDGNVADAQRQNDRVTTIDENKDVCPWRFVFRLNCKSIESMTPRRFPWLWNWSKWERVELFFSRFEKKIWSSVLDDLISIALFVAIGNQEAKRYYSNRI